MKPRLPARFHIQNSRADYSIVLTSSLVNNCIIIIIIIITSAYIALFHSKRFTILSIITQASGLSNQYHLNTPGCKQRRQPIKQRHNRKPLTICHHHPSPVGSALRPSMVSNSGPSDLKATALTTELRALP